MGALAWHKLFSSATAPYASAMALYRTAAVVETLAALDSERWRYVQQVAVMTGRHPATVSGILTRLERAGLAESRWEEPQEATDSFTVSAWQHVREGYAGVGQDRQQRRYFRLTASGVQKALDWGPTR